MIRRWSLVLAFAMGVASFSVYPLGLGEIQLNSALNQHLNADIKLLSVNPDELVDVSVKLASPSDFKKAGIERTFNLTRLRFRPKIAADGKPVIHINSREPVREPFLNFLLEVNWPNGRTLREYTLLLDPPVTLDRRPAPVQPAIAQTVRRGEPITESPVASSTSVSNITGEYGPVRRNETLWAITEKVKPAGVTMEQMMISLLRSNPHAFIDNNVNRLKVGEILRIPTVGEVRVISSGDAREIFKQQTRQWQSGLASKPVPAKTPQDRTAAEDQTPTAEAAAAADKLKIATPQAEGEDIAGTGEAAAAPSEVVEKLEQELITAKEEREGAIQEGEELKTKVGELESQLRDLQKLLNLKDDQLARLQETAGKEAVKTGESVETTTQVDESIQTEVEPAVEDEIAEAPETTITTEEKVKAPEVKPVAEPVETVAGRTKRLFDTISSDPTILGTIIAVLAVLLALLWVVMTRRRSTSTDFQESILVNTMDDSSSEQLFTEDQLTHTTETTSYLSDFTPSGIDALQEDTGEVDPLAEADVYIAYGRYQQAEELVRQAIAKDPERIPLKLKLFEIYYATKNAGAFSTLAKSSLAEALDQKDPDGWAKVKTMGSELLPDNEHFSGDFASSGMESELDSFEVILDADSNLDKLSDSEPIDSLLIDGLDSDDFNLGELPANEHVSDTDDTDLDFDLGLDLDLGGESDSEQRTIEDLDPTIPAGLTTDLKDDNLDLDLDSFTDAEYEATNLLNIEDTLESAGINNLDLTDEIIEADGLPLGESGDSDEISTKLDLARAYVEMGDADGAKDILEEVLTDGDEHQRQEAKSIIDGLV